MKNRYLTSTLLIASMSAGFRAEAASGPVRFTLREALAAATDTNPVLLANSDRVDAAQGLRVQAGLKPNPRVVIQSENARAWESSAQPFWRETDTYVYGAQVLERGQKRERRIDYASAGVARAQSERDMLEAQFKGRVATAYWNAAAATRIVELYHQDLDTFGQILEFNRSRVQEGALAGIDLMRIEIERDQLLATSRRTEQEAERARIELAREMGKTVLPAAVVWDSLEEFTPPVILSIEEIFRRRKDVLAAEALIRQADRNIALQKANAKTDPEFQLGYKRTAGFDTLYGAVSIPLAVRNRNEGNISAAEAESRNSRHLADALRIQVRAEFEAASRDYLAKRSALEQTIAPLRTKTRDVARIADAAYREGGVDLLRFLDAERVRIETDVLYFRSLADLQQSIVNLKLSQGDDL
ncbi:MAG TPA: TolC family protein [Bryobacteraceae bacterium]|nr:TolC family protein [Bryobacteraceae bacterium]